MDNNNAYSTKVKNLDELIKNPRSIMPHFLVPGHPLSHKLLEEEKIGKSLVG